jgi:hypothetical protein
VATRWPHITELFELHKGAEEPSAQAAPEERTEGAEQFV